MIASECQSRLIRVLVFLVGFTWTTGKTGLALESSLELRIATFQIDATPPIGTPLCDALVPPAKAIDDPLSCRGIILLPREQPPIVLVAVDWVGIGNGGHDAWRKALAVAVDTSPDRVCVHALHQHDAPGCDFAADILASKYGLNGRLFNVPFARQTIARAVAAAKTAQKMTKPVTHIGAGRANVHKVASNRRLLGPNGKVKHVRYTSCKDPVVRALPEGTIDPEVRVVSFWDDQRPIAVLTYYATHPQSYYGQGSVSADFVGLARSIREDELPGVAHIHFNGAGGNVGAGKYNDGSPANRPVLAQRLAAGMKAAWQNSKKFPCAGQKIDWKVSEIALPPAPWLNEETLIATIQNENEVERERLRAVRDLTWLRRCQNGRTIAIGRLRVGPVHLLHLPGELFVEYQLAAQTLRPDALVCTAAYGDYGPGYIGLQISYQQGGYETGRVSRVSPRVESVLTKAISQLMR